MKMYRVLVLLLLLSFVLFIQGCLPQKPVVELVKQEKVLGKVKIESQVSHQGTNWLRVTGSVINTSEYSVSSIDSKLTLVGDGGIFDTRLLTLSQAKVLKPGETLSFDSTFDYGTREVPSLVADAKIVNLQVIQNP